MPRPSLNFGHDFLKGTITWPEFYIEPGIGGITQIKDAAWSVSRNWFLLGVGSIAFPGEGIKKAVSHDTHPWITLQFSLFLGF
ncbi:hypothetical protein [Cyanothece sp. BG0011]|uniref:hypothetical protein n=1 Tax=Cyanothece sp. BG0011 TaxID=2082950 RepID=UPI000D1E310D|nr:hypothetical protein [Cyanothece sp. BG0011]